jgi:hypothetical protein
VISSPLLGQLRRPALHQEDLDLYLNWIKTYRNWTFMRNKVYPVLAMKNNFMSELYSETYSVNRSKYLVQNTAR